MVAYYERADAEPPGPLLVPLAQALGVTTDPLFGVAPAPAPAAPPRAAKLLQRFAGRDALPAADQRAVLKMLDALLDAHQRGTPRQRATRAAG